MSESYKSTPERLLDQRRTVGVTGTQLEPAVWYDDFTAVKSYAEKTGHPFLAMWINPVCGFCQRFCDAVLKPDFTAWLTTRNVLCWLGSKTDPGEAAEGKAFVFTQSEDPAIELKQRMYFPGIALWQCEAGKPDHVLHDYRASGRVFEKERAGQEGLTNILAGFDRALEQPPHKAWTPPPRPAEAQSGGCPGGHPHLKALQEIAKIIAPFTQPAAAAATGLRIRMNPKLDLQDRNRRIQALLDNGGRCPCQRGGDETACLCADFMRQDKPGLCRCGLYEKY